MIQLSARREFSLPPATSAEENRIVCSQGKAAKQVETVGNYAHLADVRCCFRVSENDLFTIYYADVESARAFLHGAVGLMARLIKGGAACWRNEL